MYLRMVVFLSTLKSICEKVLLFDVSSIIFWSSRHRNKQHQQSVTLHQPIHWGITRLSFIWLMGLEPSLYVNLVFIDENKRFFYQSCWKGTNKQLKLFILKKFILVVSTVVFSSYFSRFPTVECINQGFSFLLWSQSSSQDRKLFFYGSGYYSHCTLWAKLNALRVVTFSLTFSLLVNDITNKAK